MKVSLIASPYDRGRDDTGMASGPTRYLRSGVSDALSGMGFEVEVETIGRQKPFEDELAAAAAVNARLAELVNATGTSEAFPLVLGGNCDSALGALAGVGTEEIGIVWFDAHGDFNTPGTSRSGYLAGMPVATVTGHCHAELWEGVGGEGAVPDSRVLMVGVRDLDPEERSQLEDSEVAVIEPAAIAGSGIQESLRPALGDLRSRVEDVYLHLDVDVLDPNYAPGVDFPTPGGLSVDEVEEAVRMIAQSFRIRAVSLTAYNPDRDEDGMTLGAGTRLMITVAETVAGSQARYGS